MFGWLRRFLPQHTEIRIVLYTRQGCHLCDDAWEILRQQRTSWGFALESVDIDDDPDLRNQYDREVPVVTVNGKVRFRGRVNEVLLRRLLKNVKG